MYNKLSVKDFIRELYYDNISPQDRGVIKGSRLQKLMGLISTDEEILSEKLSGEEKHLFLEYANSWSEALAICEEEKFIIGFRLGAQFTFDTFARDKALTEGLLKE